MKLLTSVLAVSVIGAAGYGGSALQDSGHLKNDGSKPIRPVAEVIKEHNQQLANALKEAGE